MTEYYDGTNCFWDILSIPFDPKGTKGYALCLKTTDNGRKWQQFDFDKSPDYITPMNFDSLGNYLVIGWRSSDKGKSWDSIKSGLNHTRYNLLSVSPSGYYFMSAENGGLYRSHDRFVSVEETPKPSDGIIINPNPATDFIEVRNPNYEIVTILNILGETIFTTSEISKIDVSTYPRGIYLVRIGDKVSKFVKI
jgi:hypothetical protein